MSAIIVEHDILHYEVLGRGRPLIFLHGWVGSWRYWIPTMQATSVAFRSYAIDLWGFGDSAKKHNRYTLDDQVRLLEGFLEEMGIGKIALVGHGLGAIVAMKYIYNNPRFVDRFMAVGLPLNLLSVNNRIISLPPVELGSWLLGNSPDAEAIMIEIAKTDQNAITTSIDSIKTFDIQLSLETCTTPCLLVHGQLDSAISPPPSETLNKFPESNHQILFEESGHFPMIDQPNKFNRLLSDFLALNSGDSPRQLQLKEEWKRRVR